jgi:hypothetical protein
MSVREGQDQVLTGQTKAIGQFFSNFIDQRLSHAEIIEGDDHDGRLIALADGQRFGPKVLRSTRGLFPAPSETIQPNRISRGYINCGSPNAIGQRPFGKFLPHHWPCCNEDP